jgi:hypothetical protein
VDILECFQDEQDVPMPISRYTTKKVGTKTEKVLSVISTNVKVIFFLASQAQSLIAQKIREDVDAVAITDVGTDVLSGDVTTVYGETYSVAVKPDDVAYRGEALVIMLKGLK